MNSNSLPGAASKFPSVVYALNFSSWKKPIVRNFFAGAQVTFVKSGHAVPPGGMLAVWGSDLVPDDLPERARVVRLEDGFLRSVGLGADLIRPVSWVMDSRGLYYDVTRPSDLEVMLQSAEFTDELLLRAAQFRERIVSAGLTKYNVGMQGWQRPINAKRVILVPGQVESDASLRYGALGIRRNLDLLRAVRTANPDAYVLYKSHPDVLVGLRAKGVDEDKAETWCDEQVSYVSMGELLPKVDEVHVLTSLAGFEALLRGKAVSCYGQPFYAGWGLTRDMIPTARRTRKLTLNELVAGSLLLYPAYMRRDTGALTTPEQALDELLTWRADEGCGTPLWRKLFRVILRRVVGVR
jgi:capsular polysaccharide export protein